MIVRFAALAALAFSVSGCMSSSENTADETIHFTAPNSEARLNACAEEYAPESREFIECWSGVRQTFPEICTQGQQLLGNRWADDWQKLALYESLRNRGCLG